MKADIDRLSWRNMHVWHVRLFGKILAPLQGQFLCIWNHPRDHKQLNGSFPPCSAIAGIFNPHCHQRSLNAVRDLEPMWGSYMCTLGSCLAIAVSTWSMERCHASLVVRNSIPPWCRNSFSFVLNMYYTKSSRAWNAMSLRLISRWPAFCLASMQRAPCSPTLYMKVWYELEARDLMMGGKEEGSMEQHWLSEADGDRCTTRMLPWSVCDPFCPTTNECTWILSQKKTVERMGSMEGDIASACTETRWMGIKTILNVLEIRSRYVQGLGIRMRVLERLEQPCSKWNVGDTITMDPTTRT